MADKVRYAWFGTAHLWQHFEHATVETSRTGESRHQGVTRERVALSAGSPNFETRIRVTCRIGPAAAAGSLDGGDIAELQGIDTDNALRALGKVKYELKFTYDYAGSALNWKVADAMYVGMTMEPPDYDAPQIRRAIYTFEASGALTLVSSISSFRVASL
jgi:hypothetical protein